VPCKPYSTRVNVYRAIRLVMGDFASRVRVWGSWFDVLVWYLRFFTKSLFVDEWYYVPSRDDFEAMLEEWRRRLQSLRYIGDRFDCDDYAVAFKAFASEYGCWNSVGFVGGILCVDGECVGHAWNLALVHDNGAVRVVHVEPQVGDYIEESDWSYRPQFTFM